MIFKEQFKIGLKDVEKDGSLTNIAILEYLENIASFHSDSVGYGLNGADGIDLTWILLDWKVQVIKRPKYGNTLNVSTWSKKIIKFYAYRDFEIYDENNELCVIASSKWLLIDTVKGKIAKVPQEMMDKYDSETGKTVFDTIEIEKLKVPKTIKSNIIYKVQRKDIDMIGHMHNLYYLDLVYEALPEEVYESRPFDMIRIMYKKEIKLGDSVLCNYTYEDNKHIVVIQSQDESVLHAIVELK